LPSSRAFFVNSALAFAAAQLLSAALHETGHGLAAQMLGFSPKIYGFYEDNPTGTPGQSLIILAAGPCTSLVLGCLFLLWFRRGEPRYTFGRLFLFWMAWVGIMSFVNYVLVTPWLTAGDTAKIADILNWPTWFRYALTAASVVAVVLVASPAARDMFAVTPQTFPLATHAERRRVILRGFYLPLIAGVVLLAPAGIGGNPAAVLLGMFGAFGSIDVIAAAFRTNPAPWPSRGPDGPLRIEPAAIAAYVVMVAAYVFVCSHGLPV